MIKPQKYCGLDLQRVKPVFNKNLIISNKYSYRIYNLPQLKILIDGVTFDKKIRCIHSQNEFIYVGSGKKLYTVKHNIVDITEYQEKIEQILIFYPLKIVQTRNKIYIDEKVLEFAQILGMLHIPTYLNKIIVYGSSFINIVNVMNQTIVHTIDISLIGESIQLIKETPALDIIAVAVKGQICLFNIQDNSKIIYRISDSQVRDIAFNSEGNNSLMAVASLDCLRIYDLNQQALIYTHKAKIDWVYFYNNSLYLGEAQSNRISQYSLDEFKVMSLIRERTGFQNSIKTCRYYGLQNEPQINLLLTTDNQIRYQSIVNENMAYSKSLKLIAKQDFSVVREHDWANLLVSDESSAYLLNIYDSSVKPKLSIQNGEIQQVLVSRCGNFGFICQEYLITRVSMQSGSTLLQYSFKNKFQRLFVDMQNQYLIVAQDGQIVQLDFVSARIMLQIASEQTAILMTGSINANIVALALKDSSITVIDYSTLRTMRKLEGHNLKILDMALTNDNQFLLSCSLDRTIKIWNLLHGNLVQEIQIPKPVISIAISENQLATVFLNSRSIAIWKFNPNQALSKKISMSFNSDLSIKAKDARSLIYQNQTIKQHEIEQEYNIQCPKMIDELISFTNLEDGKWVPIQYIDSIRERNKVKLPESDFKIPFFMDFRNTDQEKQNILNEVKDSLREKSKIMKIKRDQYLEELKSPFEKMIASNGDFLAVVKHLSPTSYDYEIRSALMGKPENILRILKIFQELFINNQEFDLKVTYLMRFLKVAREDWVFDEEIQKIIESIANKMELEFDRLEEYKNYVQCIIEYAKIRI